MHSLVSPRCTFKLTFTNQFLLPSIPQFLNTRNHLKHTDNTKIHALKLLLIHSTTATYNPTSFLPIRNRKSAQNCTDVNRTELLSPNTNSKSKSILPPLTFSFILPFHVQDVTFQKHASYTCIQFTMHIAVHCTGVTVYRLYIYRMPYQLQ